MFKAKDIMSTDVIVANVETDIYEAMNRLAKHNISGIPVVDHDTNLVGIISEKDMLGLLVDEDAIDKKTVADFMTKKVASFSPEESVVVIAEFFLDHAIRRVPIVDNNQLVGIITRGDVISLILNMRGKSNT